MLIINIFQGAGVINYTADATLSFTSPPRMRDVRLAVLELDLLRFDQGAYQCVMTGTYDDIKCPLNMYTVSTELQASLCRVPCPRDAVHCTCSACGEGSAVKVSS